MLWFLFTIACFSGTHSARILAIFPLPSVSHQVVFNAYIQELVKHEHEVVVVTPNPTQPKDNPLKNLTEITVTDLRKEMSEMVLAPMAALAKRGVVLDADASFEAGIYEALVHLIAEVFKNPQLKSILEDKNQHFDLIVLEAFMDYQLITSKFIDAPVILLSSFYGVSESFDIMGAMNRHPIFYPSMFRNKFKDLSIWETIKECYNEYKIMKKFQDIEELENVLLKQNFGPDTPTIKELKDNVAMLFLNSHPFFAGNRPVPPSVLYLGGLHLKRVKELPQDLKTYLDSSKRGVVYVSLGSSVRPELMHKDLLEAFIDAFEAMPYDVLWKYDGSLEKNPKNVKVQKWFPQRDLLAHPNIKVFVTQGGMQSTDEAIDGGVPLVGIPMQGDQWFNTNRYIQLGIGMQLDALTLTANDLSSAVKTVIGDESFRENIRRLKEVINDQPQRPLERAVWWTEHVVRHRGATHLRAPGANITWTEYLMLNTLFLFLALILTLLFIVIIATCFKIQTVLIASAKKSKIKSN